MEKLLERRYQKEGNECLINVHEILCTNGRKYYIQHMIKYISGYWCSDLKEKFDQEEYYSKRQAYSNWYKVQWNWNRGNAKIIA